MNNEPDLVEDNVVVLSIESIKEFYVKLQEYDKTEARCHKQIQLEAENESEPAAIALHDIYLAKYDEKGLWYRAQAREVHVNNKHVRVFFLDLGKYGVVKKSLMKTCLSVVRHIKGIAEKCSLVDKLVAFLDERDSNDTSAIFKKLVSERKRFKMIIKDIIEADGTCIVDLITMDRLQNFSVSDFLLTVNNFQIIPRVPMQTKAIKSLQILNGTSIKVHRVESPSEFYVSVVDMKPDKDVMDMEMSSFYEQSPANLTLLMPGVKCATEDTSGKWHRVEVLSSPDCDGWCKVRDIDNDKFDFIKWQALFELDKQFYNFPSFSLRCSLGGIKAIGASWSDDSTEFLRNNIIHQECETKFFGTADNAKLFVINKETKINVNQLLIFYGHAQSTDETKEPEKVYEPVEADKPDSSEELSEKLHPVQLIDQDSFDPLDFRVKYLEFSGARRAIMEQIQSDEACAGLIWKVGNVCLVFCCIDKEESQWHRAIITDLKPDSVHVVLCDYGIKVDTSIENLKDCPAPFKRFKCSTTSAKLAFSSKGSWTKKSKDIAQSIVNSYDRFYIIFEGDNEITFNLNSNPRPAILWGQLSQGVKLNINSLLEEIGLISSLPEHEELMDVDKEIDTLPSSPISIQKNIAVKTVKDKVAAKPVEPSEPTVQIKEYSVVVKKQLIDKWLPALRNNKLKFVGTATTVDRQGNVVLHEWKHNALLKEMSPVINGLFQGDVPAIHQFKIGEPCTVRFEQDSLYYRGQVVDLDLNGYCSVEFLDYGNIQKTKMKKLFREVVCTEIPPLAQRYRLEGSPTGAYGQIDQDLLDKLHVTIVDFNIEINVIPEDASKIAPNYVKRCWITVDDKVIKSYNNFLLSLDQFIKPVNPPALPPA